MEQKLFIKNRNNLNICIKLNTSSNRNKLVFLEHGLSARKEYPHMKVMEEIFAENGYNVINFDATNSLNESDSSPEGITFTSHYQDLEDVIEWTSKQSFYNEPFALCGQSLGAASCINFAGTYSDKVKLLIAAACPIINGKDLIKKDDMMIHIEKFGFLEKYSKSADKTLRINKIFNDDIKKYDLTKKIQKIKARTFIIQGLLDAPYIVENSKNIYQLLKTQKELILLKNTPHDLANTSETALASIASPAIVEVPCALI